jgi:hypothetical protein
VASLPRWFVCCGVVCADYITGSIKHPIQAYENSTGHLSPDAVPVKAKAAK